MSIEQRAKALAKQVSGVSTVLPSVQSVGEWIWAVWKMGLTCDTEVWIGSEAEMRHLYAMHEVRANAFNKPILVTMPICVPLLMFEKWDCFASYIGRTGEQVYGIRYTG